MGANGNKRLLICAQCGHDWLAWTCPNCGGTEPRRVTEATMRRLRDSYEQRKQEGVCNGEESQASTITETSRV